MTTTTTEETTKTTSDDNNTLRLDSTPDQCYNCGTTIERGWLIKIKVFIESPLDKVMKFKDEPKEGEPKYSNDKICPACTLVICGILNKDVLHPEMREKGIIVKGMNSGNNSNRETN